MKNQIYTRQESVLSGACVAHRASLGSTFAALCCGGVPAVLGAISLAGLGFRINDMILLPLVSLSYKGRFLGSRERRDPA